MKKIRYAVAGLGHVSQNAVLPAFKNARNSELSALITGDEAKRKKLGELYRLPREATYAYRD